MSELSRRASEAAGQCRTRDSHINLGLIGRGLHLHAEEPGRVCGNQLELVEETAASGDGSAQLRRFDQKEKRANEAGQLIPTSLVASDEAHHTANAIQHESPWKTYEKGYDLKLDHFVTITARKAPRNGMVAIRKSTRQDAGPKLDMIRRISHKRLITLLEVFDCDETIYVVFEHVFTSLK